MLVKQFHYIRRRISNGSWVNQIHKAQSNCAFNVGWISEACSIMQKFDFKIEISQFNQQKKEENTCELFQYQTDFTKLSENI
jgi:hypothetical protein